MGRFRACFFRKVGQKSKSYTPLYNAPIVALQSNIVLAVQAPSRQFFGVGEELHTAGDASIQREESVVTTAYG